MGGRKVQNLLTVLVAGIVTAASATGMWRYFADQLHISDVRLRAALFAVFELSLLVSALRARRYRIQHGRAGADDAAVWALAVLTGVLAATDEDTWGARAGRVALPLVAAWLFERAIAAERSDATGQHKRRIAWRLDVERIAVWLRLADAGVRDVAQIDRSRRLARLATAAYRAHTSRWLRSVHTAALRRHLAKANRTLGLASDPVAVNRLRAGVALLFEGLDQTSRDAVRPASPWTANTTVHEPQATADRSWVPTDPFMTTVRERSLNGRDRSRTPAHRRAGQRTAARKLLADYVAEARAARTPGVQVTPAWVRSVTGCSRGLSSRVAAALNDELDQPSPRPAASEHISRPALTVVAPDQDQGTPS